MRHPFAEILDADVDTELETQDTQTRRDVLQSAVGLGVGAVALGVAGTALSQGVTTQAIGEEGAAKPPEATTFAVGEEGAKRPPAVTRAGPGHPEHGGRPRPMTKAGPAHPEHAGQKVRNAMSDLAKAQTLLARGDWAGAAAKLTQVRKLAKPEKDKYGHYKRLQQRRDAMEKPLKKAVTKALDKADKQAESDALVPALLTYRKAKGLDEHYGFQKRVDESLTKIGKHKDYAVALKKVEKLEAEAKKPKKTTLAIGEEGGKRLGITTKAIGEEGGRKPPRVTTDALGEEGGDGRPRATTFAIGEEG